MRAKESREMYLETILRLEKKNGVVRSVDIAKEFNYSKPSISKAMNVLKKSGLITHTPYGDISLTKQGRQKAEQIFKLHRLVKEFLIRSLNLDEKTAEQDACRMEHIISDKAILAIEKYLEND